ncbi:MAG: NAD(P)H-hydrate epimerase [Haloarculaceae archaeon]
MPLRFTTSAGVEVIAITADRMREVDRVATDDVGLGLLQMMENAGRNLARHARKPGAETVVVAGNGGNGGGGLACARHLANRGDPVRVLLDRPPADLTGAAARQHAILDRTSVPVHAATDEVPSEPDVVVDALVGYGLGGDLREPAASYVAWMNRQSGETVSLDVPTGLDATSGATRGAAVAPDSTLTLALPKRGLVEADGELHLADIGIPRVVYDRLDIPYSDPFGPADRVEIGR